MSDLAVLRALAGALSALALCLASPPASAQPQARTWLDAARDFADPDTQAASQAANDAAVDAAAALDDARADAAIRLAAAEPEADYDYDADFRAPLPGAPRPEDCRLAETAIYMPDGLTRKTFTRVCRNARGQFQVAE